MSKTYQPKKKKRARVHGFLARSRSSGGRKAITRRRRNRRKRLSV
ncbi:MAG: 50S ribosomal protein L34 [Patescibacteria group bacterium]